MSASDAAPLPRLGEVFFDVRGHSRSMRLSWYADTGIAVFSIWQGGRCTGTFRLPMDDLARMTEILQRGPQGRRTGSRPERGYGEADYDGDRYDDASIDEGQYDDDWFAEEGDQASGRGPAGRELTERYPGGRRSNRPSAGRDSAAYERPGRYADSPADPGAPDGAGRYEFPTQAVRPPDRSYPRASGGLDREAVGDLGGYSRERFARPYAGSGGEAYPNDNPAGGPAPRHGAGMPAYHSGRRSDSAELGNYLPSPLSDPGYPGGPGYRPAADPGVTAEYQTGRHSGQRMHSAPAPQFTESEPGTPAESLSEREYWRRQAR